MTPPDSKVTSSDFSKLVLGTPPSVPPDSFVTIPAPSLPSPGTETGVSKDNTPDGYYEQVKSNPSVAPHLEAARKNPVDYLESLKKGWFEGSTPEAETFRKNYRARDTFLTLAFAAYHENKNPVDQQKLLALFMDGVRGYVETLKEKGKEGGSDNLLKLADGYRRLTITCGALLRELKSNKRSYPEETQLLQALKEASQATADAIGNGNPEYQHIGNYARARALLLDLTLTPPSPAESGKKLKELRDALTAARNAVNDQSQYKDEYTVLIDAELSFLPKAGAQVSPRQFIAHYTANFVMMTASEIDLTDGDSKDTVEKRYKTLSSALEPILIQNPDLSFAEALGRLTNSLEADHLKGLMGSHEALQDLRDTEKNTLVGGKNLSPDELVGKWGGNVIGIVQKHSRFTVGGGGEYRPYSFQEILRQFSKTNLGTAPSPISQSLQDMAGITPKDDQELSKAANAILLDMDSSGFKFGKGVSHFLSLDSLSFIVATSVLNRVGSTLLIRRAGEVGELGRWVKEGQLTGWGHFAVGTGVGGLMSAGFAGVQYLKDSSAGRAEAGATFWRNLGTGIIINTAALGLSAAGGALLKNRFQFKNVAELETGNATVLKSRLNWLVPHLGGVAIGTGGMLGANAIVRGLHNAGTDNPKEKVPLFTLDETVETALTMSALPMCDWVLRHGNMRWQLGEFRTKQVEAVTNKVLEKYLKAPSSSPYGKETITPEQERYFRDKIFDHFAFQALSGVEMKYLNHEAYQNNEARKIKLIPISGLKSMTIGASTDASSGSTPAPKAPALGGASTAPALPSGFFPAEDGKSYQFIPRGEFEFGHSTNSKVEKVEPAPSNPQQSIVEIRWHNGKDPKGEIIKLTVPTTEAPKRFPMGELGFVKEGPAVPKAAPPPPPPPPPKTPPGAGAPPGGGRPPSRPDIPFTATDGTQLKFGDQPRRGLADGQRLRPTIQAGNVYAYVAGVDMDPTHPAGNRKIKIQIIRLGESNVPEHILRMDELTADKMNLKPDEYFVLKSYEPPAGSAAAAAPAPAPKVPEPPRPSIPPPAAGPTAAVHTAESGDEFFLRRRTPGEPKVPSFTYAQITKIEPGVPQDPNSQGTFTFTEVDPDSFESRGKTHVFKIKQGEAVRMGIEDSAVFVLTPYSDEEPTINRAGLRAIPVGAEPLPAVSAPFLAIDDNQPGAPRRGRVKAIFDGFGEVAGFTHEGIDKGVLEGQRDSNNAVNEDGFGIDPEAKIIVVADGMGGLGKGDQASAVGVRSVLDFGKNMDLGQAFLGAHQAIRANCGGGACVASAVKIHPNGTVETAIAGDARLWILTPQEDGSFNVIEPYLPDSVAVVERVNPAATLQERLARKQYYEKMMKTRLDDREMRVEDTLMMNASMLNSVVRSGLGIGLESGLRLVPELSYNFPEFGQVLHTKVQIPLDTADPAGARMPLVLQDGYVLLLMSDGVADLVNRAQLAEVFRGKTTIDEMNKALEQMTHKYLQYYQHFSNGLQPGQRAPLPDGRFIDYRGDVYASANPADTKLIAHYGPDNITAVLYRHNPSVKVTATTPSASGGPKVPDPRATVPPPATREASFADVIFDKTPTPDNSGVSRSSPSQASDTTDTTGQYGAVSPEALFELNDQALASDTEAPPPPIGNADITMVNQNLYQKALAFFKTLKTQIQTDTLPFPGTNYGIITLKEMTGGPKKISLTYQEAPICAENQIVLEIKTDDAGHPTEITLADSSLENFTQWSKTALNEVFGKNDEAPTPTVNRHVVPRETKPPAPLVAPTPRPPSHSQITTRPTADSNATTVQTDRWVQSLLAGLQKKLTPYFDDLEKRQVTTGQILFTRTGDGQLHAKWQPHSLKAPIAEPDAIPHMSQHLATVEIKGDITKDPNAFEIVQPIGGSLDPRFTMALTEAMHLLAQKPRPASPPAKKSAP